MPFTSPARRLHPCVRYYVCEQALVVYQQPAACTCVQDALVVYQQPFSASFCRFCQAPHARIKARAPLGDATPQLFSQNIDVCTPLQVRV